MIDWNVLDIPLGKTALFVLAVVVLASSLFILRLLRNMIIDERANSIQKEYDEVLKKLSSVISPKADLDSLHKTYTVSELHRLLLDGTRTQEIDAENGYYYLNVLRMISHTQAGLREAQRIKWRTTKHSARILKRMQRDVWRAKGMLGLPSPLIDRGDEEFEFFEDIS